MDVSLHVLDEIPRRTLGQENQPHTSVAHSPDHDDPPADQHSAEEQAYGERLTALASGRYLDYPMIIGFQTLVRCNASCSFCPYPTLARKGERIDDALITKFIDELADIPADVPFSVNPSRVNEPLLDKRVLPMVFEIERRYANASTVLFTNGSTLTDATIERLCDLERLATLNVSFNDHRPDEYARTMRLDYARTVRHLDRLHGVVRRGGVPAEAVRLSRVGDGSRADDAFVAWCLDRWPAFQAKVVPRDDWMGDVAVDRVGRLPNVGCMQWFKLQILASGRAAFCCIDASGDRGGGSFAERHLLELYNEPWRRKLRERTPRRGARRPRTPRPTRRATHRDSRRSRPGRRQHLATDAQPRRRPQPPRPDRPRQARAQNPLRRPHRSRLPDRAVLRSSNTRQRRLQRASLRAKGLGALVRGVQAVLLG